MGKQTNQKGSHFGGEWTLQKLHIIEEYLKTYATVLKNQRVKKIYVDGFAGSGKTELKSNPHTQDFAIEWAVGAWVSQLSNFLLPMPSGQAPIRIMVPPFLTACLALSSAFWV